MIEGEIAPRGTCPGLGNGMTNVVFQIDGRRQDLKGVL